MAFEIKDGVLIKYEEESEITEITIPDGVTTISEQAFMLCGNLTGIFIPDSVTNIGESSFSDCNNLKTVSVPEHLKGKLDNIFPENAEITYRIPTFEIKDGMLRKYNHKYGITEITIPDNVKIIMGNAFSGQNKLTHIIIPDSVTTIGGGAFQGCIRLTNIIIPDSITKIGKKAFFDCKKLKTVTVPEHLKGKTDNVFPEDTVICYGNSEDDIQNISGNNMEDIVIPENTDDSSEKTDFTTYDAQIEIPAEGFEIKDGVLTRYTEQEGITEIIIPSGITVIGKEAFRKCDNITDVILPDGITAIEDRAFFMCGNLRSVIFPESLITIGNSAFKLCRNLDDINIPDGVNVAENAFEFCKTFVPVPEKTKIQSSDTDCFKIEDGVLIKYTPKTSVISVTIPDEVTAIGNRAFSMCENIVSINIPETVTYIGERAFEYCNSLTSITIPASITRIDNFAFAICTNLENASVPEHMKNKLNGVFSRKTHINYY